MDPLPADGDLEPIEAPADADLVPIPADEDLEPLDAAPAPAGRNWVEQDGVGPLNEADPYPHDSPEDAILRGIYKHTGGENPEIQASVYETAKWAGVPGFMVRQNLKEFRKAFEDSNFDPKALREKQPEIARLALEHPEMAGVIIVDEKLSAFTKAVRAVGRFFDAADMGGRFASGQDPEFLQRLGMSPGQAEAASQKKFEDVPEGSFGLPPLDYLVPPDRRIAAKVDPSATGWFGSKMLATYQQNAKNTEYSDTGFQALTRLRLDAMASGNALERMDAAVLEHLIGGPSVTELLEKADRIKGEMAPIFVNAGPIEQFAVDAMNILPSIVETTKAAGVGGAAGAALGSVPGIVAKDPALARSGALFLGSLGARGGSMVRSFQQESGGAFLSALDEKTDDGKPMDPAIAAGWAVVYGAGAAAIEGVSFGAEVSAFGPLGDAIRGGTGKAFLKGLLKEAGPKALLKDIGKRWLTGAIAEAAEEGSQQALQEFTTYLARSQTAGTLQTPDIAGASERIAETMGTTFAGMLPMAVGHAGVNIGTHLATAQIRQELAARDLPTVKAVLGLAESPTLKGAPEIVAKMVADATAKNGEAVTSLHVDPHAFTRYFQSENDDPAAVNQAATEMLGPDGPRLLQEAVATGGKLEVPMAQYAKTWIGNPAAEALAEDTATQAHRPTTRQQKDIEPAAKKLAAEWEKNNTAPQPGAEQAFVDAMEAKLATMDGQGAKKARTAITLWRALVRTQSEVFGNNADDIFAGMTAELVAGDNAATAPAGAMAQPAKAEAQPHGASVALTDRLLGNVDEELGPITAEEMAAERYLDPVSGLRNIAGWEASPRQAGKLVAAITSPDIKAINDDPTGGHDTANALLRVIGAEVAKLDPEAARKGTNFLVHVESEAQLAEALEKLRAALPDAKLGLEAAIGFSADKALTKLDTSTDAKRAKGELPERGKTNLDLAGLPALEQRLASEPVQTQLPAELVTKASSLSPAEHFAETYLDKQFPGILSGSGWHAIKRKAFVASIDIKGLKDINLYFSKATGNKVLAAFAHAAQKMGGGGMDLAHLSGDEFAAQHDSKEALEAFLSDLQGELRDLSVHETMPNGHTYIVKVGIRTGVGEKTYGAADRALNTAKRAAGDRPRAVSRADAANAGAQGGEVRSLLQRRADAAARGTRAEARGLHAQAFVDRPGAGPSGATAEAGRGSEQGVVDPAYSAESLAAVEGIVSRIRIPAKKAMARAFLDFITRKTAERPSLVEGATQKQYDEVEKAFAAYGLVDPINDFTFGEDGRSLERSIGSRKGRAGAQPDALKRHKEETQGYAGPRQPRRDAMDLEIDEIIAEQDRRKAFIDALKKEEPGPREYPMRHGGKLLISKDPSKPGAWRVTRFEEENGELVPTGHTDAKDFPSAIDRAADYSNLGYAPSDKNIVFQDNEPGASPRGYTEIATEARDDRILKVFKVALNKNADLSTFLHESGHVFLEIFGDLAAREDAPERVRKDYATLLKWFEVESRSGIQREHHEKFARGLERYLLEGKAPSAQLEGAFARFKIWLTGIYRSVASLNVDLNDEVRGVFDRLLATDEEIERAKKSMGLDRPLLRPKDFADPADYEAYLEAQEQASSHSARQAELTAMKDRLREQEGWWKEEEAKERSAAAEQYEALPARATWRFLNGVGADLKKAAAPTKLDKQAVKEALGEERWKLVETTKGGVNPDEVAEMFGFPTGAAMLEAVVSLKPKDAWVKETAAAAMNEKHPDILTDRTKLQEVVSKGLHGDQTAKWLIRELNALRAKARGPDGKPIPWAETPVDAIKQAAKLIVDPRTVGKLNAGGALQAERSAADKATRAVAKGDYSQAYVYKQQQLLNMYLHRELTQAREHREAFVELTDKLSKDKARERLGKASPVYRDAVDLILETFGLKEPEDREGTLAGVREVVATMESDGATVMFDPAALDRLLAQPKGWKDFTVGEMRAVSDALKNIQGAARARTMVILDEGRAEKDFVVGQLIDEAKANLPLLKLLPEKSYRTMPQSLIGGLASVDGSLLDPSLMVEMLGGLNNLSSFWVRAISTPLRKSKAAEVDILRGPIKRILSAFEAIPKSVLARSMELIDGAALFPNHAVHSGQPIPVPSRRAQLLMMALNSGNESNLKRLLEGRNISEQQLHAALGLLTKEEMDWVQSVWDAAEDLKGPAFDLEERDSGLRPEAIAAKPLVTRHGTYRGGYFPAAYDRAVEAAGERQAASTVAGLLDPSFVRPGTPHGHLKGRAQEFSGALSLEPNRIATHLAQVAHDIAFREAIKSVGALVMDPRIQATLKNYLGDERASQFLRWLKDTGQMRGVEGGEHASAIMGLVRSMRGNVVVAALGYAVPNAIEDLSNLVSVIPATQLKTKHLAAGLLEFGRAPMETLAEVEAKSGEMRSRRDGLQRELGKKIEALTKRGPLSSKPVRWLKEHAFIFMEFSERATSTPIWVGAYRQALAAQKSESEAIAFADSTVGQLYASHHAVDKSAILRDKGFIGTSLMFYGFLNRSYNALRRIFHPLHVAQGAGAKAKVLVPVGAKALAFVVAYGVLSEYLRGRGKEDDEEWEEWFLRKMLAGMASPFPGGGDAASAFEGLYKGKQTNPRSLSLVGAGVAAVAAGVSAGKAILEGPEDDEAMAKVIENLLRAQGPILGLPASQLIRTEGGIRGEQEVRNPFDAASRFIYGEKSGHPANPLSDIGDAISGDR